MTAQPLQQLPLATRPRRPRVQREPSQRAACRALRRSAPPTTAVTWRRSALPGREVASAGVPAWESAMSLLIVVLLFVPVLVASRAAGWAVLSLGAAVAVASYLLWARRVVAGEAYVAVRRLGRYHVARVDHVRHLELRPTSTGGVLCVHTGDGRCMRLRRAELARPELAAALRALASTGEGTHDARVRDLLDLPPEDARLRARYLPGAC